MKTTIKHAGCGLQFSSCSLAFTLIELLVLLAILAVLAGMLLPALAQSKVKAQGIQCMNNHKQLALAWFMYADDYSGKLARNEAYDAASAATSTSWAVGWLDWTLRRDNIDTAWLTDKKRSLLAPYLGANATVFRCPADSAVSPLQKQNGWSQRVRSVAMNFCMGEGDAKDKYGKAQRIFKKTADIPTPATTWVLTDEHPDSLHDACFWVNLERSEWDELPASLHNGAGGFAFSDGHSEIHKWQDRATLSPVRCQDYGVQYGKAMAGNQVDYQWLKTRTTVSSKE